MSAILVTAATTPPGIELCRALAVRHQVLASGPEPAAIAAPRFTNCAVRYLQADLAHSRSRRTLLFGPALELGVETVVYGPQQQPAHPHAEADAVRELLHLCERHPSIGAFVYRGTGEVYRVRAGDPSLIDENHPLELGARASSWTRDRVEADQAACAHAAHSRLRIAVLRFAEPYLPDGRGPLLSWLRSRPCLRPLGHDPVVNLISLEDVLHAIALAVDARPGGVFNLPGADLLPLSELAERSGRLCVGAPGCLLASAYALLPGAEFGYASNRRRLHFGGVLCGDRAAAGFGYRPRTPIRWPREAWPRLTLPEPAAAPA